MISSKAATGYHKQSDVFILYMLRLPAAPTSPSHTAPPSRGEKAPILLQ